MALPQLLMNRKNLFLIILLVSSITVTAQRHEIGLQLGTSNLVGDIGSTSFIFQKPIHFIDGQWTYSGIPFYGGIAYRLNMNPYQTIRFNLGYSHIQFNDLYASELYRKNRELWGTNEIAELDVLFEYNFFPVNDEQQGMLSPFVFGGLGGAFLIGSSKKITGAVPFGAGLKYKFNYNWAVTGSFTFRPTFSDDVDYSERNNVGNLNSKDWVNSATLMLSYAFGRPPCYCK